MRIRFIGTGAGSSVGTKRVKSSILINDKVLLDLGPGADLKLEDLNLYDKPIALFISHLHVDHFSGIFDYLVQRKIRQLPELEIYSPRGLSEIISSYIRVGNNISARLYEGNLPKGKVNDLEIYSVNACHTIYAVSYVILDGKRKILYSGDTKEPCEPILEEVKDSDLIIHESTCIENCEEWGHTSLNQILSLFKDKKVVITHIPIDIEEKIINLGNNKVTIAFDGMTLNV
ncbi:MAG: MBL fold metallo-hydrolase [Saccharolobus sp.]|jgi:ribonuclease BN (tRNA processing enzyme)|uniref:MBL fold metallo-hydrolase n=1 Tax=Saccharolobus sp. TaxID=2100761 RepID=UPI0028CCB6FE|nr:MBL fold metallo-hydrolase [Saccharolobus sp.]MDT7860919.1 MBL fold metallo-hydrolase [Saccharolobus sp.]